MPREIGKQQNENSHWLAFWSLIHQEARRIEAYESEAVVDEQV